MLNVYVPMIPVSDLNRSFEDKEHTNLDSIFVTKKINGMFTDDSITKSKHYGNQDYTRHVFSNMGKNLFSMDERNIPIPIREYEDITQFGMKYLSKEDIDENEAQGVYIVERYNIYDIIGIDVRGLLEYYYTMSDLTKETVMHVEDQIYRCTPGTRVTMRVITYIPKKDIDYYRYVYSPVCNLSIVKGTPHSKVSHPRADYIYDNVTKHKILKEDHSTTISLDIVDNDNIHKPYYMNIGNKTQRIISTPSNVKPNGLNILVKKDNEVLNDKSNYELRELHNIGIYDREDLAKYNGDNKGLMEDKNMNLLDRKIDLEHNKLNLGNKQLENEEFKRRHERFTTEIDKEVKIMNFESVVYKSEFDYNMAILNMEKEVIMNAHKIKLEEYKEATGLTNLTSSLMKLFVGLI